MDVQRDGQGGKPADYMAGERTFLAWVRTAITIIALGFVVVKFGLLTRELGHGATTGGSRLSAPIGVTLVLLGGVLVPFALARLHTTERDLAIGAYRSHHFLTTALAVVVALVAALLAVYLAVSGS